MVDTFYIGGYWKERKQLLDDIIAPTLQTLDELRVLDDQFLNLYALGMSRKQALKRKVLLTFDNVEELYKEPFKKNDLDHEGYSKIGYRLSLWTGHIEGEASTVTINAGSSSIKVSDLCLIKIPSEGLAKGRLLKLDKVKEIINIIIRNWDPDTVVLNSKELSNALDTVNEVGWVTYKKGLNDKLEISDKIVQETDFGMGSLFYLKPKSDETYDYNLVDQLLPLKKQLGSLI